MIKKIILLIVPLVFLVVGIVTIRDYGINWDNPLHFSRGQSYLWYFLTGQENYKNFPLSRNTKRSFYQYDDYNFEYFVKNDSGHPPLSDILSALTNYIFYQKLNILSDTASYHLFIVGVSFLLILSVAFFVKSEFGLFPAIVSSLVLVTYPLFFSESHFNIKDPPETAFFGLTLIFFYWGVVKNNWKYVIASSISAGLALGTKLNIIFVPIIVSPWFIYYLIKKLSPNISFKKFLLFWKERKMLVLSFVLYLPVCLGLVYISWPFLWQDPVRNVFKILSYYYQIGMGTPADLAAYIFKGWNLYPIFWIIVTTTIPVLILLLIGLTFPFFPKKSKKDLPYLLIFLWFWVPILRTSFPKTDIYGGVRQIMEFVPALAILCGVGVYALMKLQKTYLNKKIFKVILYFLIVISLSFSVFEMVRIHPNENVYFNQLVGGLSGAKDKNIPSWGNTYGNVYLQGIKWINENAEEGSKVALPIGVMSNIPRIMLRADLDYTKPYWSGPNRGGEYGIEMDFEWFPKYWYSFQYYDQYLNPVYTYSVDGVTLLKVWKNDLAHTKPNFKEELTYKPASVTIGKNMFNRQLEIDLGRDIFITRLVVKHSNSFCQTQIGGYIALSNDGKNWRQETEPITSPQVAPGVHDDVIGWSENNFVYLFAGKKARYIILDPQMENSCYLKNYSVEVRGLKTLP